MEMSSAATLPESSDSDKFPTFTGLPNVALRSDSIFGRKLLASIKKGMATAMTISTATMMPTIFRARFMIRPSCQKGKVRSGWRREQRPSVLLGILQKLGRRDRAVLHLLLVRGAGFVVDRSEERRVGKECRSRW